LDDKALSLDIPAGLLGRSRRSAYRADDFDVDPCARVESFTDDDDFLNRQQRNRNRNRNHYNDNRSAFYVPDMVGSSAWLAGYSVGTEFSGLQSQFTLPTMLLTRPNATEHFSADVQNRLWADYRHWNNAVSRGQESRAVEQFSFGLEKQILRNSSVELRVPMIYQFGSGGNGAAASVELGNILVFAKQVFRQRARWTISGGIGSSVPTAENWRPGGGAQLKNNGYYLVSFLGMQWHPNNTTFGHFLMQADLPVAKHELVFGDESVKVSGQQIIRSSAQLGRWIYRADQGNQSCRLGIFAEFDYAVVTKGSEYREAINNSGDMVYVNAFGAHKSTFTAAVGMPMVFGRLTCTNAVILPMSGNDRPFSVGYNFSLSRQF
jgi:hypothetical protein